MHIIAILCFVPAGLLNCVCMIIKMHKPLLVTLLRSLYRIRNLSLCQFVAKKLGNELNLRHTSLTSEDALAIGYFLSSVSLTALRNVKEFKVDLDSCSLGDAGTKSLMQSICKSIDPHSAVITPLDLSLLRNEIHEECTSYVAEILNCTNIMSKLWLGFSPIGDKGLQAIFDALKQNKTLKSLYLFKCGMTDTGVASLADALRTNNTLEYLSISCNDKITDSGLAHLIEPISRHPALVEMGIARSHSRLEEWRKNFNQARRRNGMRDCQFYA